MSNSTDARPCRKCGAMIRFIRTAKGTTHPVDAVARVALVLSDGTVKHGRLAVLDDDGRAYAGYTSHFATCPHANEFRNQGGQ